MNEIQNTLAVAFGGTSERIAIGDVVDQVGRRGHAALLMVPALVLVSPLSGIPGMSVLMGALIVLCASQMALGLSRVWLPGPVRRLTISRDRFGKAAPFLTGMARAIDGSARPRLQGLVSRPVQRLAAGSAVLLGLILPAFEVIPFSSSIVGVYLATMMAGFLTRDGLIVLLALVPLAALGAVVSVGIVELFGSGLMQG